MRHVDPQKRHTPIPQELAASIAESIRDGNLGKDGWLPPERLLATQLSVSRPALREAIKRLEAQGLIEVRRGVGLKVVSRLFAPLNASFEMAVPSEVDRSRQLTEVRMILEPEVARLAAIKACPEHIALLKSAQSALASAKTIDAAIEADIAFHRALALATDNQVLVLILDAISDQGRQSRRSTIGHHGKDPAYRQHQSILRAVERGTSSRAAAAMRRNLESTRAELGEM